MAAETQPALPGIPESAIPMTRAQADGLGLRRSWDHGWRDRETETEHLPDPRRKDDCRRAYEAGWATRDILAWGEEHDRVWPLADPAKRPAVRDAASDPEAWDRGFAERLSIRCPDDSQRLHEEALDRGEKPDLHRGSELSGWWAADREIYRRTFELWKTREGTDA